MSGRLPAEFDGYPGELAALAPFGPYRAVICHVTDGDTLDVLADTGFNDYRYLTIRVAGVDAPELFSGANRAAGEAAREFVCELVSRLGLWCVITSVKWPETFGRYVGAVTLSDGTDLATALLAAGHAKPIPG